MKIPYRIMWLLLMLFVMCGSAAAESFRIQSRPDDGWPIEVQGSATIQRLSDGILISITELSIKPRYTDNEPLFISSLKFEGSDETGKDKKRTALMFSERLPIGKPLPAGAPLVLHNTNPIFMKQPGWHQDNARFDLIVEIRVNGGDGLIPIATTLHELKLPSNFSRRTEYDLREGKTHISWLAWMLFVIAAFSFVTFVRWCKTDGKNTFVSFIFFIFVWCFGWYPTLRLASSILWIETGAHIIDTGIKTEPPRDREARFRNYPIIKYQYEFDGKPMMGTQVNLAGADSFRSVFEASDAAKMWDQKRITGERVRVWVNPLDHTDAVLIRQTNWMVWLLFLLGFAGLFVLYRNRNTNVR